jgi:hypothetical protein
MPITLLGCIFQRGSGKGFGSELYEQEIRAERALIGIHLADESSPSFTGIAIELENLTAWAFDSDITLKMGASPTGERCWAIEVEQKASRFAHLNGMKAELRRGHVLIDDDRRRSHVNVATREISSILLGSRQPRPLSDWLRMVDLLQDLISLAMDTPCAVLSQIVFPSDEAKNDPNAPARTEVPIYTQGILAAQPDGDAVRAYEALFTLNDRSFGAVLTRWVYVQKRFTMACHMVLGLRYMNRGYLETQLTTVVGAAEVFHRQLRKDPPIPKEEFAAMKARILEDVPDARRQWVDSRLWNEPSLRERLVDLATTPAPEVMNQLVPNPKAWAKATALARNGIAHRGRTNTDEMSAVVTVTRAVVIVNLLHQLEIPKERMLSALADLNDTLSSAARLSAKYWPS